jgi:hypothetical protein
LPSDPIVIFSPLPGTLIVLNAICLDTYLYVENMRAPLAVVPTARRDMRSNANHIANGERREQSAASSTCKSSEAGDRSGRGIMAATDGIATRAMPSCVC